MREPQFVERGMFERAAPPPTTTGASAPLVLPALLPKLSGTPGATRWAGPELGHHTEEVLRGELGMGGAEIARLRELGAI
jgi:crotonobetainyl-CoA:carnitine CoA-transferase CaiB-like acyl-CoA transferase